MSASLSSEAVEAIALRVAELIEPARAVRLLTVGQVAEMLQVTREWVYAHADDLGALRLGTGSRGRLRFDRLRVIEGLGRPARPRATPARRRSRMGSAPAEIPLLRVGPKR